MTNYFFSNLTFLSVIKLFLIFCNFAISNSFILLKIFKFICVVRFTFELFPEINMDVWPFYFFKLVTHFYFLFWLKLLPPAVLSNTNLVIDLSRIVAIECLDGTFSFYYFLSKLPLFNITFIRNLETIIKSFINN